MQMTNEQDLISFGLFSSCPYCSIVNNKLYQLELMNALTNFPKVSNIMISDKYNGTETIWEAIKSNYDSLIYKTLDECIDFWKNNGNEEDMLPIEISEEDALNPNNYELQEDGTYKYIKI